MIGLSVGDEELRDLNAMKEFYRKSRYDEAMRQSFTEPLTNALYRAWSDDSVPTRDRLTLLSLCMLIRDHPCLSEKKGPVVVPTTDILRAFLGILGSLDRFAGRSSNPVPKTKEPYMIRRQFDAKPNQFLDELIKEGYFEPITIDKIRTSIKRLKRSGYVLEIPRSKGRPYLSVGISEKKARGMMLRGYSYPKSTEYKK